MDENMDQDGHDNNQQYSGRDSINGNVFQFGEQHSVVNQVEGLVVKQRWVALLSFLFVFAVMAYLMALVSAHHFYEWIGYKEASEINYLFFASGIYLVLLLLSFFVHERVINHKFFKFTLTYNSITDRSRTYVFGKDIWKIKVAGVNRNILKCYCLPDVEKLQRKGIRLSPYIVKYMMRNEAHSEYVKDLFYTYLSDKERIDKEKKDLST